MAVTLGEAAEEAHGALDADVSVLLPLEGRALLKDHPRQRPAGLRSLVATGPRVR